MSFFIFNIFNFTYFIVRHINEPKDESSKPILFKPIQHIRGMNYKQFQTKFKTVVINTLFVCVHSGGDRH